MISPKRGIGTRLSLICVWLSEIFGLVIENDRKKQEYDLYTR